MVRLHLCLGEPAGFSPSLTGCCLLVPQDLQGYDFQSDIYSFGITAIELARGTVPYLGMPPTKVFIIIDLCILVVV